jgi:hypothetical protein
MERLGLVELENVHSIIGYVTPYPMGLYKARGCAEGKCPEICRGFTGHRCCLSRLDVVAAICCPVLRLCFMNARRELIIAVAQVKKEHLRLCWLEKTRTAGALGKGLGGRHLLVKWGTLDKDIIATDEESLP